MHRVRSSLAFFCLLTACVESVSFPPDPAIMAESCPLLERPSREPVVTGWPMWTGCMLDSDCPGPSGRCVQREASGHCSAHQCEQHTDCPSGSRCLCGRGALNANVCVEDHCSDSCSLDTCSVGTACTGPGGTAGPGSVECRTTADECALASDCPAGSHCVFSESSFRCIPMCAV